MSFSVTWKLFVGFVVLYVTVLVSATRAEAEDFKIACTEAQNCHCNAQAAEMEFTVSIGLINTETSQLLPESCVLATGSPQQIPVSIPLTMAGGEKIVMRGAAWDTAGCTGLMSHHLSVDSCVLGMPGAPLVLAEPPPSP